MMRSQLIITAIILSISFNGFARNICKLVKRHPEWHKAAKQTEKKWGVPVHIQFAIIDQESDFKANAKSRKSSAKGFAQALNESWGDYLKANGSKHHRHEFNSSTDFIGWYGSLVKQQVGISPSNAYEFYLAYHEGIGGYKRHLKHPKRQVMRLARHISVLSGKYKKQLSAC